MLGTRFLVGATLVALVAACGGGGTPTPPPPDSGSMTGTDGGGMTGNTAPTLGTLAAVTLDEGTTQTVTLSGTDPDGDALTFALGSGAPTYAALSGNTLTLAPTFSDAGAVSITVTLSDGKGGTATGMLSVTVNNVNRTPVFNAVNAVTLAEGTTQTVTLTASDPDGDALTFAISGTRPAWVTLAGAVLTLAPTFTDAGSYTVSLVVTDPSNALASRMLSITVSNANGAPVLGGLTPQTMAEGTTKTVNLSATDPDGDTITFALTGTPPAWASITGSVLTLSPTFTAAGMHTLTIEASDPSAAKASGNLTVTVTNVNRGPSLGSIANVTMAEGQTLMVTFTATDPDSDMLTFTSMGLPAFGTIAGNVLTLAPMLGQAGVFTVIITASDGDLTDSKTFTLSVSASNTAPNLSNAGQFDNASAPITPGATVTGPPTIRATVADAQGDSVKLEVEVTTGAFTNVANQTSALTAPGTLSVPLGSLPAGNYKWQVRALDSAGLPSAWTAFNGGATAFVMPAQPLNGSITVNASAAATNSATVSIALSVTASAGGTLTQMQFSNDGVTYSALEAYATSKTGWALSAGDGSKTVYARVLDSNANSSVFSDGIIKDTSLPTITSFTIKSGATATNAAASSLDFVVNDTGTGIASYEASNDGVAFTTISSASPASWGLTSSDGTKTVTLRVTDGAGNTATATDTIVLDTALPLITAFSINSGAAFTNSTSATANTTVTDVGGSGVNQICISTGGPSSCQSYAASAPMVLPAGDGVKTAIITVSDAAGNVSTFATDSITLDATPPTLASISINSAATYATNATVSISGTASDTNGVEKIAFSTDGVSFASPVNFVAGGTSFVLTGGDGTKTVYARVVDFAGNVSLPVYASDSIILDTAAPVGSFVLVAGNPTYTLSTGVNLVFSGVGDATTMVTHYCAKSTNVAPTGPADVCWTAYAATPAFTLTAGDGLKTVYVWLKDSANNFSASALTDTITLDATLPTVSAFNLNASATVTNLLSVTGDNTATDGAGSGLSQVCFDANPTPTTCVAYATAPGAILAAGDGTKTMYLRVRDAAGNYSTVSTDTINLDQTAPTVTGAQINGGLANTNSLNLTITSTAADMASPGSGVAEMSFSENGTVWGSWLSYAASKPYTLSAGEGTRTVYVRVRDNAGNISVSSSSDTIVVDTVPPSGTLSITGNPTYTKTSPASVNVATVEAGSGVSQSCIKVTNVGTTATPPTGAGDACFGVFATPVNVAINGGGDGNRRIWVWLLDNAGNVSSAPATLDIWYDATLPTTPGTPVLTAGHRQLTVAWTNILDASSGIAGYQVAYSPISMDASAPLTALIPQNGITGGTTTTTLTLPNGTLQYIRVLAVDRAGNVTPLSAQASSTPRYPFAHQHRMPSGSDLTGIAFRNNGGLNRYIVAGLDGTLYSSDDGLVNYTRRDPMVDTAIRSVISDSEGVWAVGDFGYIGLSTDDGALYNRITNNQPATQSDLLSISYAGFTGSGLGTNYHWVAVGNGGTILRGSRSLLGAITSFSPVTSGVSVPLRSVTRCFGGPTYCTGAGITVAVGDDGTIVRSLNAGSTWTAVTAPTGYTTTAADFRAVVAMPNSDTLFATLLPPSAGRSGLIKSTDGGAVWVEVVTPSFTDLSGYALAAFNATDLWIGGIVGASPAVVRLVGVTRTAQTLAARANTPVALVARSATEIAYAAPGGDVSKTVASPTWTAQATNGDYTLRDLSFPAGYGSTAWACGEGGYIAQTANSGTTWARQGAGITGAYLNGIAVMETGGGSLAALGFAVGTNGTIVKTTTGGGTWALDADTGIVAGELYDVTCRGTTVPTSVCFAVGVNQTVVQWNGTNWVVQTTGAGSQTYLGADTYLAGGTTPRAIVVGSTGALRLLNNTTWANAATLPVNRDFQAVRAKKDTNGIAIAVGTVGAIYKSADHGATWTVKTSGTSQTLYDVDHISGTTTWFAVGGAGVILKSIDDGETWAPLESSSSNTLFSVVSPTTSTTRLYAGGGSGTILYSSTSGQ